MSSFDAGWLALREPYDRRARDRGLIDALAAWLAHRPAPHRIVDLGAGTGALARALEPLLPGDQRWLFIDRDERLLDRARDAVAGAMTVHVDLARDLGTLDLADVDVVATSALLDLVSSAWLDELVGRCARSGVAVYASLSVDGRISFTPVDEDDDTVCAAFAKDQHRDKGFGLALGSEAAGVFARALDHASYATLFARSDWQLGPGDVDTQTAFLDGMREAASQAEPTGQARWEAWYRRRCAFVAESRSRLCVGHRDVLGLPS